MLLASSSTLFSLSSRAGMRRTASSCCANHTALALEAAVGESTPPAPPLLRRMDRGDASAGAGRASNVTVTARVEFGTAATAGTAAAAAAAVPLELAACCTGCCNLSRLRCLRSAAVVDASVASPLLGASWLRLSPWLLLSHREARKRLVKKPTATSAAG